MKKLSIFLAALAFSAAVAAGYSATKAPTHSMTASACCPGRACSKGALCKCGPYYQ